MKGTKEWFNITFKVLKGYKCTSRYNYGIFRKGKTYTIRRKRSTLHHLMSAARAERHGHIELFKLEKVMSK